MLFVMFMGMSFAVHVCFFFFFSSRRRHTRCALVTGVQTCALLIWSGLKAIFRREYDVFHIHWLERAFWGGGRFAVLKAVTATQIGRASCRERVCQYV